MIVYFDKLGDIKGICPREDLTFSDHTPASFEIKDVEEFLLAKKNMSDYVVKQVKTLSNIKHIIERKYLLSNNLRTIDNYLTKIPTNVDDAILFITNEPSRNRIVVSLSKDFINSRDSENPEQQEIIQHFINNGIATIHITERDNPYNRLFSMSFSPRELFDKENLYFKCERAYTNTSAYTKKIIDGYIFREK